MLRIVELRMALNITQDTYVKLVDANVLAAGKTLDQRSWISRATKETLITNGRNSPAVPQRGMLAPPL